MITLKFPKLEKALLKKNKDLASNDVQRGIFVYDKKAFIKNNSLILCFDLYEYFTLECGVEDDEELKQLNMILLFMEGKVFSSDFWSELTKGADMEIDGEKINISNPKYSKELIYKEFDIDVYPLIKTFSKYTEFKSIETDEIAIPFNVFKLIGETIPTELKNDSIMFHFKSTDQMMMFTFHKRKYVFGLILPDYVPVNEAFKYDYLYETAAKLLEIESYYKPQLPIPPTISKAE